MSVCLALPFSIWLNFWTLSRRLTMAGSCNGYRPRSLQDLCALALLFLVFVTRPEFCPVPGPLTPLEVANKVECPFDYISCLREFLARG
jgi:hypothetical protein